MQACGKAEGASCTLQAVINCAQMREAGWCEWQDGRAECLDCLVIVYTEYAVRHTSQE